MSQNNSNLSNFLKKLNPVIEMVNKKVTSIIANIMSNNHNSNNINNIIAPPPGNDISFLPISPLNSSNSKHADMIKNNKNKDKGIDIGK